MTAYLRDLSPKNLQEKGVLKNRMVVIFSGKLLEKRIPYIPCEPLLKIYCSILGI